jgi:type VI protein secretion system component VasK
MDDRKRAMREFRRMIGWIALAAILMVAGALWYLSLYEPLRLHMVVATVLGVFFSVLLGCGLFAAAFFSDKSGHDAKVGGATRGERDDDTP